MTILAACRDAELPHRGNRNRGCTPSAGRYLTTVKKSYYENISYFGFFKLKPFDIYKTTITNNCFVGKSPDKPLKH